MYNGEGGKYGVVSAPGVMGDGSGRGVRAPSLMLVRGSSGPRDASRDAAGDASSGFAIRSPPKALDKLKSPFMAAVFSLESKSWL